MAIFKKSVLVFMTMLLALSASTVNAQTSDDYLAMVRDRCDSVKTLLEAQRKHDLVARINRGRAYQNIIDQQQAISLRLRNNQLTSDAFDRQLSTIQQGVERFRSAYNRYDDALGSLVGINCRNQALEFVQQLLVTRVLRASIGSETAAIDVEFGRYREVMIGFQKEVQRLNSSVLGEER